MGKETVRSKRLSLKTKSTIAIMLTAILLSTMAIIISYRMYSNTMNEHYRITSMNIAKAAASLMDGDKLAEYIKEVDALNRSDADFNEKIQSIKDKDYFRMLNILFELKESHKALYLYVQKVSADGAEYIMDADIGITACELGETDTITDVNYQYLNSLENGIPAFITNTEEYGWLCTAGAPIFNSKHQVVALAFVDISMADIMADRHHFLIMVCVIMILAATIATSLILIGINRTVIHPINDLSLAAGKFVSDKNIWNKGTSIESAISTLDIRTGDEIEKLCNSIKTMEKDINKYIENLTAITAEKERIAAELNVAKQIQASVLPCIFPAFPDRKAFDIYATMHPAKEVGGDFYDFFLVDRDHLAVVIADVSGKGVPAALFMVITKSLIKNQILAGKMPAEAFTSVNTQLCESNEAGMIVSAWLGLLEISSGNFTYVNAGFNPLFIKKAGQCFETLPVSPGFVLAQKGSRQYQQMEIRLDVGDVLYLYTDGVTKAANARNEFYGEIRLQTVLNRHLNATPGELLIEVKEDMNDFVKDAPQLDDITMLALVIKERGYIERKVNS